MASEEKWRVHASGTSMVRREAYLGRCLNKNYLVSVMLNQKNTPAIGRMWSWINYRLSTAVIPSHDSISMLAKLN